MFLPHSSGALPPCLLAPIIVMVPRLVILLAAAATCAALELTHAAARSGICPNVPTGMLNAVNKMSRATPGDPETARAMRLTPTHLFHNNTDVYIASCALKWELYHANPDQLNFFKFIQLASSCGNHNGVTCVTDPPKNPRAILCTDPRQYKLPRDNASIIVERVSDYSTQQDGSLDPALFIFHEGRVGSTLTANMFASSRQNLVFVEDKVSTSLIFDYGKIWAEAGSQDCKNIVVEIVRAVMRRQAQARDAEYTGPHHSRVVYKFEPHALVYYEMLSAAFPSTPWVFLYRQPVETLWSFMSVLHDVMNPSGIYCVRNQRRAHAGHIEAYRRREPDLSVNMDDDELRALLRDYLPKQDFCALHLEMLQQQALKAVDIAERANPGVKTWALVDHKDLPGAIATLDEVLPTLFAGQPLTQQERTAMVKQGSLNAKGLKGNSLVFRDDRKKKRDAATPEVRFAARFMTETYGKLAEREAGGMLQMRRARREL